MVSPTDAPRVDIIVPVYNAERTLPRCLEALHAQLGPFDLRIIVVDDGSTDGSAEIARQAPCCVLAQRESNGGIGAARNTGLAQCDAPFIGFVDSDIYVEPDWLALLLRQVTDGANAAVGYVLPARREQDLYHYFDGWLTDKTFAGLAGTLPEPHFQVLPFNYLFRREVFERLGPFDERFTRNGEDTDFLYRMYNAGLTVALEPQARAAHDYQIDDVHALAARTQRAGREVLRFHIKWRTGYLFPKAVIAGLAVLCIWAYYLFTMTFAQDETRSKTRLQQGRPPTMMLLEWRLTVRYFKALGEAHTFVHALFDPTLWDKQTRCKQPLPSWFDSKSPT